MVHKLISFSRAIFISYIASLLLLSLSALALWKLQLKAEQMQIAIYAIYAVSCCIGGFFTGRSLQNRRILWGMLFGLLYFFILFLLSALFIQALPAISAKSFIALGLCLSGGLSGAFIS